MSDRENSKVRYIALDARQVFKTAKEAREHAKNIPGFNDGYVFCVSVNLDNYVALGGDAMAEKTRHEIGEILGANIVPASESDGREKMDTGELKPVEKFSPTLEMPTVKPFFETVSIEGEEAKNTLVLFGDIPAEKLNSCTLETHGIKDSLDVVQAQKEVLYIKCVFANKNFASFCQAYAGFSKSPVMDVRVTIAKDCGDGESLIENKPFVLDEFGHSDPEATFVLVYIELRRETE